MRGTAVVSWPRRHDREAMPTSRRCDQPTSWNKRARHQCLSHLIKNHQANRSMLPCAANRPAHGVGAIDPPLLHVPDPMPSLVLNIQPTEHNDQKVYMRQHRVIVAGYNVRCLGNPLLHCAWATNELLLCGHTRMPSLVPCDPPTPQTLSLRTDTNHQCRTN